MPTETRTGHTDLDFVSRYTPGTRQFMVDVSGFVVEFGLTGFQLMDPHGPGGGNPVIRFYGDADKIDVLEKAWEF